MSADYSPKFLTTLSQLLFVFSGRVIAAIVPTFRSADVSNEVKKRAEVVAAAAAAATGTTVLQRDDMLRLRGPFVCGRSDRIAGVSGTRALSLSLYARAFVRVRHTRAYVAVVVSLK